jgi:hypothetical protein
MKIGATLAIVAVLSGTAAAAAPPQLANPCLGPGADHRLVCPDLRVGPAEDLYVVRAGGANHDAGGGYYSSHRQVRLHAGNDIRSRGRGPIELRGRRSGPGWMRANQAIHRVGGGIDVFRTDVRLRYYDVGPRFGGSYWKVEDPLSMEIWSLGGKGRPLRMLRKGPKVYYCFRDLERTRPGRRSPPRRVYPACSQDGSLQRTKMGTSVGWSDIYPADYDRQWVDVTGLRGCHAFVMRVDPKNLMFESNEDNNRSVRIVRLPYRDGPQRC